MLAGAGGAGKSMMALEIALSMAAADADGMTNSESGLGVSPGPVCYAGFEDNAVRLRDRLRRLMGAAKSGGRVWTREDGRISARPDGRTQCAPAELRFVLGSAPIFAPGASGRGPSAPSAAMPIMTTSGA